MINGNRVSLYWLLVAVLAGAFVVVKAPCLAASLPTTPATIGGTALAKRRHFYLKNGDRVCFYGDSITEQRFYPTDVELYVRTRFPNLRVRFVNSGFGGDRVTGGAAGPINLRLKRDVFPFNPNIVTIMLGMNDGWEWPFNRKLFDIYKNGYEHIIASLQQHLPGVKIILIEPSPYDDVTHGPGFAGGYNAVLIRYGQFVHQLAVKYHLMCVNFNKPLLEVLRKANRISHSLARKIIPGRIHPDADGQLVMAEALLKAWNAPATVTAVDINAGAKSVLQSADTTVSALAEAKGTISWTQRDHALPMPIMDLHENWPQFPPVLIWPFNVFWEAPAPNWNYTNPVTAMVVKLCGFYHNLDSETLRVKGLAAPRYTLKVDGHQVGVFSKKQLAAGINLARYDTPMMAQAYRVLHLVWREQQFRFYVWHYIQLPLGKYVGSPRLVTIANGVPIYSHPATGKYQHTGIRKAMQPLIAALYGHLFKRVLARAYTMAEPIPHQYTLSPTSVAGNREK